MQIVLAHTHSGECLVDVSNRMYWISEYETRDEDNGVEVEN